MQQSAQIKGSIPLGAMHLVDQHLNGSSKPEILTYCYIRNGSEFFNTTH